MPKTIKAARCDDTDKKADKPMQTSLIAASEALLKARRGCTPLGEFPGPVPRTLKDAYSVQRRSTSLWGDELVGYKVGGIPPAHRGNYADNWLVGPVFARQLYHVEDGGHVEVTVFKGGFAAYEAELVFHVDRLPETEASAENALDCVDRIRIGAEIASSPLGDINEIGPGAIISDFGNNAGVILGPELARDRVEEMFATQVRVEIDGEEIGRAKPQTGESGPLGALAFLLNWLRGEGEDLPEGGLLVSSGAITGVHRSEAGSKGVIDFGDFGTFTVDMVARKPEA